MNLKGQNILSAKQFDKKSLLELFGKTVEMEKFLNKGRFLKSASGKILATLFFEPSTRTRFSFESAMLRLGGKVISNADMMKTSSSTKKESLCDTGKVVSQMADLIVMRSAEVDAVAKVSEKSDCPVINAGDGVDEHPTQALLDLYTVWKYRKSLDGMTFGMVGDLKNGRVPHSQAYLLRNFDVKFVLVSPAGLKMPREIVKELLDLGVEVKESEDLFLEIKKMDVVAMTRVQRERFESEEEYMKYDGSYVLDKNMMKRVKSDALILHPLPRVNEISVEVDSDPRAKYFEQVKNGVALRMALIDAVLKG
ncbi:MAG: aspartate carbamoyltransferase [Candidatus Gracilibacteria bacterium]|nr:aspartate carbamoyltransferase [Candidatus Gracilibacteria bacterium]